jgi:hypothetical protein
MFGFLNPLNFIANGGLLPILVIFFLSINNVIRAIFGIPS